MPESNSKTNKSTKNRAFIYDLVLISVSAALITICSWISIPLGPVPFTLQTLGILAVMLIVGGRRGTIAILVYLALGTVGVPVFLRELMTTPVRTWIFGMLGFLVFEVVMYIVGVIWFMTVYAAQTGPIGLTTVMSLCVFPFIIPDIVKMAVAVLIGERASKLIRN